MKKLTYGLYPHVYPSKGKKKFYIAPSVFPLDNTILLRFLCLLFSED